MVQCPDICFFETTWSGLNFGNQCDSVDRERITFGKEGERRDIDIKRRILLGLGDCAPTLSEGFFLAVGLKNKSLPRAFEHIHV